MDFTADQKSQIKEFEWETNSKIMNAIHERTPRTPSCSKAQLPVSASEALTITNVRPDFAFEGGGGGGGLEICKKMARQIHFGSVFMYTFR